jgi:uncharacterized protein YqjF (DUF2071 family)
MGLHWTTGRCDGEPGVYFFSLDAASVLAVVGARLLHRLPCYYAGMTVRESEGRIQFSSRRRHPGARPVSFDITYEDYGTRFVPEMGSLAGFLTERRRLYTGPAWRDTAH